MVGEGAEGERWAAARGRIALAAACLLSFALLAGCGIEEYVVFEPPYNTSSSPSAIFSHNLSNSQTDFLGYTVVYRIYETSAKASSAANAIEASWDSVPPDSIIKTRLAKFKPVALLDESNLLLDFPPTVKISDKSKATDVSLLFTSDGTGQVSIDGAFASEFTVKRNAQDGQEYRDFGDFTPSDDCDFEEASTDPAALVYAYAYGFSLDAGGFNEFYSQPVQLMITELVPKP